ncbi:MAG: NAD(P)/FAD-dependent oxidoreductase [Gammaproteobacteria bacterium]|nr:NAD(P)/FAD-dependent oxidoreductase [Gammaproteobacteria bacterium]
MTQPPSESIDSALATSNAGSADEDLAARVDTWLADFERCLAEGDEASLASLFDSDSFWRDVLAFTWRITTVRGAGDIARQLLANARRARPSKFRLDRARTPPRCVTRAGVETIEAIFAFETSDGIGEGIVRLAPDSGSDDASTAWTLLTALDALAGFQEHVGTDRPSGEAYSRDFRGPNWLDLRRSAAAYEDREPAVLVVGGGQAGLSIAARLTQLDVDTLIVDRHPRIGDNWRTRYHALTLHNQVQVNHLPYMPFPPNWPTYIPKDKLANWFEIYVEAMELNYWTETEFSGGEYDEREGCWRVVLDVAGRRRELRPRHVVMATGVSGIPHRPHIPGLENFAGTVLHSHDYQKADAWAGKAALVIGTGNSGHDIAQDLHSGGAAVTLVQRSSTLIVNVEPSAQLPYALYDEGPSLEDCDLIVTGTPFEVARDSHVRMTAAARDLDRELLDKLERRGFKLDFGENGTGWQFKYLTRGGGYYFNVGCSDLVADGSVGVVQFDDIDGFIADGARLKSGETLRADLVVLATGYKGQDVLVRRLFGDRVAERVGPIWGFDENDELSNMFARTGQPGLYFIAGSLAQCRIFSKYLGLQIKACEEGLISPGLGNDA